MAQACRPFSGSCLAWPVPVLCKNLVYDPADRHGAQTQATLGRISFLGVTRSVGSSILICHIGWLSSNAFKHPPNKERIVSLPNLQTFGSQTLTQLFTVTLQISFCLRASSLNIFRTKRLPVAPFPTERVTGCNWRQVSDFLEMEGPPEAHGALWQRGMLRAWEPGALGGSSQTSTPASQPPSQAASQPAQPASQPPSQPPSHPATHPASQPASHPATQPPNQPTDQPTNQPTNQPTKQQQ